MIFLELAFRGARRLLTEGAVVASQQKITNSEHDLFNRLQFYVLFKWLGHDEYGRALLNKFVEDGDLTSAEKKIIMDVSLHPIGYKDITDVKLEEVFEFLTGTDSAIVTKIFKLLGKTVDGSSVYSYLGGFRQAYLPLLKTYNNQIESGMGAEAAKTQEIIKKQIYDKFSAAMAVKLKNLIKDDI